MEMKAAVFKSVNNIVIEKRTVPECPQGGLLVKVEACGICGSDVRNYRNGLKNNITDQIMGHEIAGVVVSSDSARFRKGDRVALAPDVSCGECWYCKRGLVNLCDNHRMLGTHFPGGFAQYLPIEQVVLSRGFVEPVPEGMPPTHAAFAETVSAVLACQSRCNVSLGDRVVIIGDGPVGCLHLEAARARGAAKIIILGRDKLELAKIFEPDHLLYNDPEQTVTQVKALTGGIGADIVICAVPSAAVQQQALDMVRKQGIVVIYGGVPKQSENSPLNSNRIHYGEITVTGAFSYPSTGLSDALSAIHTGKISADKYLNAVVPLEKITEGIAMVEQGKALKVMVDPWLS